MQAAQILTQELPLGWPTLTEAEAEISMRWKDEPSALFLAAMQEGQVTGLGGILPHYGGNVYEIHPLVVRCDLQRKGIGTTLVAELENTARGRGALTLWVGAADDKPNGETSLANVNLYSNLPACIAMFKPGSHPSAFYIKQGFQIVGVMPDANGIGKPDIFLAKSLRADLSV